MRKLKLCPWISVTGLLVVILMIGGCMGGTTIRNLSPVQPPPQLPEEVMLDDSNPDMFEFTAQEPILTSTQEGITLSISYWRRADLDRKFNRGNAVSPFYETEAQHQGEKTDTFYVKITNNAPRKIIFRVKGTRETPCEIVDQGDNRYEALDYDDLEERLTYMARAGGLYVKNGLAKAKEILLEKQVGTPEDGIEPGDSIEGFLPFRQVKPNAEMLRVIIPVEIAPEEGTAQRYKKVVFTFPFKHDRGIRVAQPPPVRH